MSKLHWQGIIISIALIGSLALMWHEKDGWVWLMLFATAMVL